MTRPELSEANAKFFPLDLEWKRHCLRMASYYNSVPAVTSEAGWDFRRSNYPDYLASEVKS